MLAAAAALAACQTGGGGATIADVATLDDRARQFVQDAAIASFYTSRCAEQGIGLREGSDRALVEDFIRRMQAAGYSLETINAAIGRLDPELGGRAAVAYLEARGLSAGQPNAAFCDAARTEIAEGTSVGLMLESA